MRLSAWEWITENLMAETTLNNLCPNNAKTKRSHGFIYASVFFIIHYCFVKRKIIVPLQRI